MGIKGSNDDFTVSLVSKVIKETSLGGPDTEKASIVGLSGRNTMVTVILITSEAPDSPLT